MANEWHSVRNKTDTDVLLTDGTLKQSNNISNGRVVRKTGSFKLQQSLFTTATQQHPLTALNI